ncbi:MAG: GNAT family N-acetyltransferase [SAR202 cluster bacterium]|jgi:hypothetical protein|nr:GNAT family N-acetyltransferase [SAR202 cluster bacterium]|tara:strand:- start:2429 stop:3445 length:1017 start_codon:yes stop_codon:yes gene_type:complete
MNPLVKINCIELTWIESKEKVNEWENLLIESDFPHPFSSFTFYNSWVETFVDDLTQIKMLFFYNENKLVGMAPVFIDHNNKNVSILGDKDLFDYRDIIYISGFYEEIYIEFLSYLKLQPWFQGYTIFMQSIPESSELFNLVNTDKLNNFADVEIKQEDVTPIYDVNGVWDDYLLALNKKQRHEIRRKLRKFESQDFQFKLIRNNDDLSVFLSDFYELFINSREDKKEFLTEERKTFFNKMLFAFAEKNELKILSYYDGNTLISACIVIEYANIYFLYNSAYSLDYNSYSVGLVSKIIALKQSIENNNHAFNFLRGNERYKYELGGEDIKLHEIKLLVN